MVNCRELWYSETMPIICDESSQITHKVKNIVDSSSGISKET